MTLLWTLLMLGLWLLGGVLIITLSYLLLLTLAAWVVACKRRWWQPKQQTIVADTTRRHFAFLIPAHNEELLLPQLLHSLQQLQYPTSHYSIHVVADNCTDHTAEVARNGGATVHVRTNQEAVGKGYALQWLLQQVNDAGDPYDAAVIVDADTVVSANFLQVADRELQKGARVLQVYYGVREDDSWSVGLRTAAMVMVNFLRPYGRILLGGSAGLKGNGMVFQRTVLEQFQWSASITEDIDYHMTLLLHGVRVAFVPDATVFAEMPTTLQNAQTQNVRWEQGRLEMARTYVPQLMRAAFGRLLGRRTHRGTHSGDVTAFTLFDAAMEHLIPPLAVVAGFTALYGMGALVAWLIVGAILPLWCTLYLLFCFGCYLLSGLVLAGASRKVYLSFLYVFVFIWWKLWLYICVLLKIEQSGWVRTVRNSANVPAKQGTQR